MTGLGGTPIRFDENGAPDRILVVIAKNYVRFIKWCYAHEIDYHSDNVKFVWSTEQLLQFRDVWYVNLGLGFGSSPATENFYAVLATRDMHRVPDDA